MQLPSLGNRVRKCVLRVRYNVSTGDYDGWQLDAAANGFANSPVTQVRNNELV